MGLEISTKVTRTAMATLASLFFAASSWAQTQGAAPAPLIVDGTVELVEWRADYPQLKTRQIATIAGTSVTYSGHVESGPQSATYRFTGTTDGFTIVGRIISKVSETTSACRSSGEYRITYRTVLAPDGTLVEHGTNGESVLLSHSGPCAEGPNALNYVGKAVPQADVTMVGTWRQLTVGTEPTIAVAPGAAPDADGKSSVRVEGNTIYVTDGSGTERVVTLVLPTKGAPPVFNPPTVSGEAKAFEKYVVTCVFEASYAHLPPDQRQNFISGMPMPSDVAGEAAQAVLDAGESAANWVRDNPADASLLVLSTAVSLAFPLSAFANPAVATGGAAVLRSVVGTAMVSGTMGFVQKLMSNVFTDQTALQRFKEAAAKGAGDAVATVPGSLTGAGFEKAAEQIIGKAAVRVGSVMVGITTDKVSERLQVSEKTAALVMKAPSYASSLLTLPSPSHETGGMSLTFDR